MIVCQQCNHQNRTGNLFCTSCGTKLSEDAPFVAKLVVEAENRSEYTITESEWYVGRDASNDLVINSQEISGRHLRVARKGDVFRVEDLGSKNGTFVNGQRINQPCVLQNGDLLKIGRTILTFEI